MKDGVAVLLGIRDPDDRVDAGEELVDARAVLFEPRLSGRATGREPAGMSPFTLSLLPL